MTTSKFPLASSFMDIHPLDDESRFGDRIKRGMGFYPLLELRTLDDRFPKYIILNIKKLHTYLIINLALLIIV